MLNIKNIISFFNINKLLLLILFILFQILIWYFYQENNINLENITNMIDIFPNTFFAIFILVYMICVTSLLPTLPLNIAAGFIWGGFIGGIVASIGATLGGMISFLISRLIVGVFFKKQYTKSY